MEKAKQQQEQEGNIQQGVVMFVQNIKTATNNIINNNQSKGDPVKQLQVKFKNLETNFKTWVSNQPLHVEAAIVTALNSLQGALLGGVMGTLTGDMPSSSVPPPPGFESFYQAQAMVGGPLVQARNFAVITGVNAGISCVLKRIRGKEDIQSSMTAAFGSGTVFSLVSGMGTSNPMGAISSGIVFALAQGALYKLGEKFTPKKEDDVLYAKGRSMLLAIGLQNYERNFRQGLLTDNTLPLLTDSALRDVRIPPGPRLLILDHVQRDPELSEKHRSRG